MTTEDELNARSRMENEKACDICVFGERIVDLGNPDGDDEIECRRYPPSPIDDTFAWPLLKPDAWCGEFVSDSRS